MKLDKAIKITADNYAEQQAIMGRFPEAIWLPVDISERIVFYLPETKYQQALDFINEYRRMEEKENE